MNKCLFKPYWLILVFATFYSYGNSGINSDNKRSEEIRAMMWQSGDPDFDVNSIPNKWNNKSAVVIAKSNTLSYKKAVIMSNLLFNRYTHVRIMLLDKSALEDYSNFSLAGGGVYGNRTYAFYAGFKIIKPDGTVIEVPLSDAVKEERRINSSGFDVYKIAIPNLEVGDILDYYIGEEQNIDIYTKFYSFDPIIFQLNGDYPIMKQKISFDVLRRCFINLKTLNGSPEFELVEDAKKEKNHYHLEDSDRESIKDIRWLHANRELPTIKFKVTYASGFASGTPSFIGEPGVLKSKVSRSELQKFVGSVFAYGYSSSIHGYMKKYHKKLKDQDLLARKAYYAYRNMARIKNAERALLDGDHENPNGGTFKAMSNLSAYYRMKKIPHEVIIGVPREISAIEDIILENELMFIIRVKTKNPFYIGRFDNHSISNEIDESMQGIDAYRADGLKSPTYWTLQETQVPLSSVEDNIIETAVNIEDLDLSSNEVQVNVSKSAKGASRMYYQNVLMDIYSYINEEKSEFKMEEDFYGLRNAVIKKYLNKRENYKSTRNKLFNDRLKEIAESDYVLEILEVSDLNIIETGRFDNKPSFQFSYKTSFSDLIKKVGNNYIMDIGKLIEGQIQLTNEEKDRMYNVYMSYPRSYKHEISVVIPEGYDVQGLENLAGKIENETGGFEVTATWEDNKLIINSTKYYSSSFFEKDKWPLMVEFLDSAYEFTQKQILLKKQ